MKNVKTDFGAVGDGVTDDTTAIQTAINASTNAQLLFPAGNYRITTPMTLTGSNIALIGEGPFASVISHSGAINSLGGGGNAILAFPGILSQSNVSIVGLRFTCYSGSANYALAAGGNAPKKNYLVQNCMFDGFYASAFRASGLTQKIVFDNCEMTRISLAEYSGSDKSTACLNGTMTDSAVRNCYIHDTGQASTLNHAFYFNGGCTNLTIVNNRFENIAQDAICFGTSTDGYNGYAQNSGLVCANNTFTNVGASALRAVSCTGLLFTGNSMLNSYSGLTIGPNAQGWVASNNVMTNTQTPAQILSGAIIAGTICRLVYGASNGVICGNAASYTNGFDSKYTIGGTAIMLDGCSDIEIYGNTISAYHIAINCIADNGNGATCQRINVYNNNLSLFTDATSSIHPYGQPYSGPSAAIGVNGYSKDIQIYENTIRNYPIGVLLINKVAPAPSNYMMTIGVRDNRMYNVRNPLNVDATATVGGLQYQNNVNDLSGTLVWNGKVRDVATESPPAAPAGVNRDSTGNYDPDKNFPR